MEKPILSTLIICSIFLFSCAGTPPPPPTSGTNPAVLGNCNIVGKVQVAQTFGIAESEDFVPEEFVPGEIIIWLKEGEGIPSGLASTFDETPSELKTSGGQIILRFNEMQSLSDGNKEEMKQKTKDALEEIKQMPEVEHAELNYILQALATEPNDSCYKHQWHYFNNGSGEGMAKGGINLPKVWNSNTGGSEIIVAVLDTGYLPEHQDISAQNISPGFDMIKNSSVAKDGDGRDSDPTDEGDHKNSWHGMHVAGTVGIVGTNNESGVAGVNWNVKIQSVRVLGFGGGTAVDIADGIRWAAGLYGDQEGHNDIGIPRNKNKADIINMSLGFKKQCSDVKGIREAINDAYNAGVTVVVAAGNSNDDASKYTPASCEHTITVAAGDREGKLAPYSNYGKTIDILAPGGNRKADSDGDGHRDSILSTVKGGYAYKDGTSMASPHVAGVAALILAQNPNQTPDEIQKKLEDNAKKADCVVKKCGKGLLNANITH
jgi:serine protease